MRCIFFTVIHYLSTSHSFDTFQSARDVREALRLLSFIPVIASRKSVETLYIPFFTRLKAFVPTMDTSHFPFAHCSPTISYMIGIVALVMVGCLTALSLYRLFLHPLCQFPGPRLAATTGWYETYFDCLCGGTFSKHVDDLHNQYGKPPESLVEFLS